MTVSTDMRIPEDSVLRRHYESMVRLQSSSDQAGPATSTESQRLATAGSPFEESFFKGLIRKIFG